jgi:hypothetical protein
LCISSAKNNFKNLGYKALGFAVSRKGRLSAKQKAIFLAEEAKLRRFCPAPLGFVLRGWLFVYKTSNFQHAI